MVRSGDTLSAIAHAHKTTVDTLMEMNKSSIANRDRIYPKQILALPQKLQQEAVAIRKNTIQSADVSSCDKEVALAHMKYPKEVEEYFRASLKERSSSPSREESYVVAYEGVEYVFAIDANCIRTKIVRPERSSSPTARIDRDDKVNEKAFSEHDIHLALQAGTSPGVIHDAREQIRTFLKETIGPPWDTGPIEEGMLRRQFGTSATAFP